MRRLLLILLCTIAFTGCERSQAYLEHHPAERKALSRQCREGMASRQECANAAAAQVEVEHAEAQRIFRRMIEGK